MTTRAQPKTVLILSDQPMVAALLGMLLELEGYEPAFANEGEGPEAALARVRPLLVVLVDEALDVARSDLFLARATKRQVVVAAFGTRDTGGPPPWALARRIPWFRMPVDGPELRRILEDSTASFRLWRSDGADRRRPRTETGADGTLIYHDRAGRRWQVYDRRSGDRRQAGLSRKPTNRGSGHRAFVNDAGEEWRVEMAAGDFLDESPAGLERQLARATRNEGSE